MITSIQIDLWMAIDRLEVFRWKFPWTKFLISLPQGFWWSKKEKSKGLQNPFYLFLSKI